MPAPDGKLDKDLWQREESGHSRRGVASKAAMQRQTHEEEKGEKRGGLYAAGKQHGLNIFAFFPAFPS